MAVTNQDVQKLYIAYFNRPADFFGLQFQVKAANATSLAAVANGFANSPEFLDTYAGKTDAQFVNSLYVNLFGRESDLPGLSFWINLLNTGVVTKGTIAQELLKGAINQDATTIANKVAAAEAFYAAIDTTQEATAYSGTAANAVAKAFLAGITTDASLAAAIAPAALDATLAAVVAGGAPAVTNFTLTTGVDQGAAFTGTSGADSYVVSSAGTAHVLNTLTAADVLDGGAGVDTLNITVTATDTNTLGAAQIKNIEIINVRSAVAGQTASVDASSAIGATQVNSNAGAGNLTVTSLATGAAIGVIGNGTVVNGAVTFGYATASAAATINLVGGTKVGTTITNTSATTTAATINSTGAANTVGIVDLSTAATITSLTVNAATDLTATLAADYAATAALTVTGAGKVNVGAAGLFKTVDASGSTGGLTMTLDTVTTSFKGSTGNDTITTVALAAPAAGIIDAGAGTADTLVVAAATDVNTAALRGSYTNFEVLNNAAGATIAADGFTGITSLITSAAGSGFTALTAAQAASISVTADLGATATTYALTTATGTSDVLGLVFKNATATTVQNATALTVTGFETVNLTASSGGTSLFNTAGTAAAATTTYDNFGFAAAANLKAVNVAGANAAAVTVAALAAVTSVDASANTAGVSITTGGQTGNLVVTGSGARDIIAIGAAGAGGLVSVNAGAGNDSISALQADIAVATINGGAGVDTLTVSDAGAVSINDNNFAGVTSIEKIAFGAATALTFSVGGFANALATANAGVLDVTAAALTGAAAIDATGLSAGNSLKLSLTNVDAAINATATTITLSQGADNIAIVQAGATNTDTITINGGVAALAATTVKTIDLSGVTTGGAISVTTGAGADVIKAAGIAGTYIGGLGADTFTAGAAVDTFAMGTNGSVIGTSMDSITGYAATLDVLTFGAATTLAAADATALVAGSNVQTSAGGLLTFAAADNTLALKIIAIQADTQLDAAGTVAVFVDGDSSYVYYAGAAIGNADDQLVRLVGVTATTIAGGASTIVS